jgi:formylglycine-generating enzyme required for sulfatase activity
LTWPEKLSVEGTTLCGRLLDREGQPLPLDEALSITQQVCVALYYAHGENLLHRDVKPGSIMIEPGPGSGTGGRVLVTDFGIAKAADAATATTVMPGTPGYMPPEQCRSEPVDVHTDVYSLGIVVYQMLAGRRPFVGDMAATTGSRRERVRWEQMHAEPPPLRQFNPEISPEVEAAMLRALAKDPGERWPTPLALWQALEAAAGGQAAAVTEVPSPPPVRAATPPVRPASPPAPQPAAVPEAVPAAIAAPPPAAAVPGHQPPARVALPPWVWVVGGVMLAGLVILSLALLSARGGGSAPLAAVGSQATTVAPVRTTTFPLSVGVAGTRIWDGMTEVYVPAGELEMGSDEGDSDERPVHAVALDGLWLDRTEVTNAQFAAFLNEGGNQEEGGVTWLDLGDEDCLIERVRGTCQPRSGYGDHPVVEVTWFGARAYCERVGAQLPTEAQWEYAARGPQGWVFPWGDAFHGTRTNYRDANFERTFA